MLERAIEKDIFDGELKIKVLKPEDIIGLKLQAVANDKDRITSEYADIEALLGLYKGNLEWSLLREYFSLFNQEKEFVRLNKRYFDVKR